MKIHPTAIVDKKAKLADDVEVGPYAIIGSGVEVKPKTRIGPHVVIEGFTSIGENCQIFNAASIGSIPQDLKYKGEKSFLKIGNENIIREYVTINPGTDEGSVTSIGNNNLFMAYSHVAHDCKVGNDCVIANAGTLAGYVTLEDKVIIGGLTAIHQFVRIGKCAILGGCSKVVQDMPPFSTSDGHPARVYGLNLVGLKRSGVSKDTIKALKNAFKILFHSGLSFKHALTEVEKEAGSIEEVKYVINFIRSSKRGVARGDRENRADRG